MSGQWAWRGYGRRTCLGIRYEEPVKEKNFSDALVNPYIYLYSYNIHTIFFFFNRYKCDINNLIDIVSIANIGNQMIN